MPQHLRRLVVLRSSVHSTHFKRLTVACDSSFRGSDTSSMGTQAHTQHTYRHTSKNTDTHKKNKLKINQFYIREGSGIIPKNKRTDQESCCKSRSGLAAAPDRMALGDFSQLPTARHGAHYVKRALNTSLCFCGLSKHIKVRNIRGFVAEFCSAHF